MDAVKSIAEVHRAGHNGHSKAKKAQAAFAAFVAPMLLKLVQKLTEGTQWQYEVKWGGRNAVDFCGMPQIEQVLKSCH